MKSGCNMSLVVFEKVTAELKKPILVFNSSTSLHSEVFRCIFSSEENVIGLCYLH